MSVAMAVSAAKQLMRTLELPCVAKYFESDGCDLEDEVGKLKNKITTIKQVLLDAEIEGKLEWLYLSDLIDLVYDADDLFDELATVAATRSTSSLTKVTDLFFQRFRRFNWTKTIRPVVEKMDALITKVPFPTEKCAIRYRESTSSQIDFSDILGRENDRRCVVDMLLNSDAAIFGMGGLGKTTLANLVFNDDNIKREFNLRMWVCVPDVEFDLKLLISELVNSVLTERERVSNQLGLTQLKGLLRRILAGNKYLLVLDDVWNEDRVFWLTFKNTLANIGADTGSRILITTRSTMVAKAIGNCAVYNLHGLSNFDSWRLFKRVAFTGGAHETQDATLISIGKRIVEKCANVPLAIKVIGSLLYGQGLDKWRQVDRNGLATVHQVENSIFPILKLSYVELSPSLKSCFVFCSIFPKGYLIDKNMLISLWIAQGYIHPVDSESLEEVGEGYFMSLLQRSFFQGVGEGINGETVSCKIHDLLHDLAQAVSGNEFQVLSSNSSPIHEKVRHLSVFDLEGDLFPNSPFSRSKGVRTLLNFSPSTFTRVSSMSNLFRLKNMRVLSLDYLDVSRLPPVIGNLCHLRYLSLSYNTQLESLPSAVVKLVNLQTLYLRGCSKLKCLPCDLSKLVNLRHLSLGGCNRLTHMPLGMRYLTSLCALDMFVVGDANSGCSTFESLEDLRSLRNLRGDLTVKFLEIRAFDEVKSTNPQYLSLMEHLTSICIDFSNDDALWLTDVKICETPLEFLEPHPNLKRLTLKGYSGLRFPRLASLKISEKSSSNLVKISIEDCPRIQHLPALSTLFHLRQLKLYKLENLEYIESSSEYLATSTFFPSLESLKFLHLPKFIGWWPREMELLEKDVVCSARGLPAFPRLWQLNLEECPKLTSLPVCENLKQLHLYDFNDALQLITSHNPQQSNFTSLARVIIDNVGYLKFLCRKSYVSISSLIIQLSDVEWLPLDDVFDRDMRSLESLEIRLSAKLKSISGVGWNHLVALQSLRLSNLPNLHLSTIREDEEEDLMPWTSLQCLRYLELDYLPQVVKLPKGIQYLSVLRTFEIRSCHNLKELPDWIGCLNELQSLCIEACTGLKTLPESMLDLTALRRLEIRRCSVA